MTLSHVFTAIAAFFVGVAVCALIGNDTTSSSGNISLPRCYGRETAGGGWRHSGTRFSSVTQKAGDSVFVILVCQ